MVESPTRPWSSLSCFEATPKPKPKNHTTSTQRSPHDGYSTPNTRRLNHAQHRTATPRSTQDDYTTPNTRRLHHTQHATAMHNAHHKATPRSTQDGYTTLNTRRLRHAMLYVQRVVTRRLHHTQYTTGTSRSTHHGYTPTHHKASTPSPHNCVRLFVEIITSTPTFIFKYINLYQTI